MYKWIGVLVVFCSFSAAAQRISNFKTADSLSYSLFTQAKWQELASLKIDKNLDYHYLNLRKGIAFYQLKKYHRAERYLLKAYSQNKSSDATASYLYFTSIQTGNLFLTSELQSMVLGDSVKFTKAISSIDAGGGIKLSSDKSLFGNINFFNVGLGHLPSKNISLYQSFSYQSQQDNIWGNYNQMQYYLGGSLKLNNVWSLQMGAHLHQYKSNVYFSYDTTLINHSTPQFDGDYNTDSVYWSRNSITGDYAQMGVFFYLGLTRIYGAFKWSPFVTFSLDHPNSGLNKSRWSIIEVTKTNTDNTLADYQINYDSTIHSPVAFPDYVQQFIIGSSVEYNLPTAKERFTLGFNIYQSLKGSPKTIISPFAKVKFGQGNLFVSYLRKNGISLAEYNASVLDNSYNNIHHQINAQFSYPLSKSLYSSLLYQWEDKTDAIALSRYQSNLLSFSLFFKF